MNVSKKLISTVIAVTMVPSTAFATASLSNFTKTSSLTFSDVSTSDWFYDEVTDVSAYGIINGMGNGTFAPNGNLTYAEALTLASKVHAKYHEMEAQLSASTANVANGSHWAKGYLDYATANGINKGTSASALDAPCSRQQMALLFSNAIDKQDLLTINDPKLAPEQFDTSSSVELNSISTLFQAGILIGDDNGFRPNDQISRAEAAAIILRVLSPDARVLVEEVLGNNNANNANGVSMQNGYVFKDYQLELIEMVNTLRQNENCGKPYILDERACRVADLLAQEYADTKGKYPHARTDGKSVNNSVLEDLNIECRGSGGLYFLNVSGLNYANSGTSILEFTAEKYHQEVLNSPGHKSQLTVKANRDGEERYYGVSRVQGVDGKYYWVEVILLEIANRK